MTDRPRRGNRGDADRALAAARAEADRCRRCDLWRTATQTVFGTGSGRATLMLVGEQPGDVEDRTGEPFVGPAGQLLLEALQLAGLADVPRYVTNAVKHFKWEPRGKRRIHKKPNTEEVLACRLWLEQEIAAIQPRVIVALGATAVRTLLGPGPRVLRDRGQWMASPLAPDVTLTVHPSSILRAPDDEARKAAMAAFVRDLKKVAARLARREPER